MMRADSSSRQSRVTFLSEDADGSFQHTVCCRMFPSDDAGHAAVVMTRGRERYRACQRPNQLILPRRTAAAPATAAAAVPTAVPSKSSACLIATSRDISRRFRPEMEVA
eukprot:6195058-Pleurochrysis_carterae.AAC.2